MRPEHEPQGDPCPKCNRPAWTHRKRERREQRADYMRQREYYRERTIRKKVERIIGVDGEGQGRNEVGPDLAPHAYRSHRYTYLASANELGRTWGVENTRGLTTVQCLDFLLGLPIDCLVVGYAFQYDLTKILADLPDDLLYDLFHEERRARLIDNRIVYKPIEWEGYSLNYMNRRLSLSRGKRRRTVWDIFRFFQGKFTAALIDWKIGVEADIKVMAEMKEKRSNFDSMDWNQVKEYCKSECLHLAKLARALLTAHDEAGLPLKHYYGAGSTASAFLEKVNIRSNRGIGNIPTAMEVPIACAFFGGRFENSVFGPVCGPVYNKDISSAYPYQATFLPCLSHGKWELVRNPKLEILKSATLALVHWSIKVGQTQCESWGPFPVRHDTGTIAFPLAGKGGWVWRDEYIAGRKLANVKTDEAWLYHTDCTCQPFKDIPRYYRERLSLGANAKGIVIKLGLNSIYGKLAQSTGFRPPYQSWIWAGNITSGTRSQLLEGIVSAGNGWGVLMLATDGVFSTTSLTLSRPRDTGTFDTAKPLGGWEEKSYPKGVFAVRPGIYFSQNPTEDQLKEVRARGLGKRVLYDSWPTIVDAWRAGKDGVTVGQVVRFVGAKTGMSRGEVSGVKRSANYGEWIPYPITVGFSPRPKREKILPGGRLQPWKYLDWESVPYDAALEGPEGAALTLAQMIADEQPDAGLVSE